MEGFQARVFPPMVTTKMYASYKVDEGYSEDTRSQDDPDSPMRMESGGDDMLQTQMAYNAVMALSDGEKSGNPLPTLLAIVASYNVCRIRIQYPTFHQGLIHSLRR